MDKADSKARDNAVKLVVDGAEYAFPVIHGTEQERAFDISRLRSTTGYITYDNGLANTGSVLSGITYLDGEAGILRYRGYDIEQLVEHCTFVEVAYLLIHGDLPTPAEMRQFSTQLNDQSLLHEDMRHMFSLFPLNAHPMTICTAMAAMLSMYHPMEKDYADNESRLLLAAARMISKIRTIAAFAYKQSRGEPKIYPSWERSYCDNFLYMMFHTPVNNYETSDVLVKALNQLLILHADHEQNCSTSAVRLVGSAQTDFYASMAAGIAALWGPLHGGANQAVIEMLENIVAEGGDYRKFIARAKDKNDPYRLMGFGHRVYKNYDPRARIVKQTCHRVLAETKVQDPLLDVAMAMEEAVLKDDYFVERKLYPNVDFYSGIIYRAMGIPVNMFTVMFAIGRMPGWIAHWKEARAQSDWRIWRPRQIYTGHRRREFVPLESRR